MESNEQTELTDKTETDSEIADDSGGGEVAGGGIEQRGKRTQGHGQQGGDCWGQAGVRGIWKKYSKD